VRAAVESEVVFLVPLIVSAALFVYLPAAIAAPLCAGVAVASWYARRALVQSVQFAPRTGIESMAGRSAVTVTPLSPDGVIRYQGELWRGVSSVPIDPGTRVRIVRVERALGGLTAVVEKLDP
jgi:membrane-bound ClpP family serine protease